MCTTWQVYYKRANRKGSGITVDLQGAQVLQRSGHKRQFVISAGARHNWSTRFCSNKCRAGKDDRAGARAIRTAADLLNRRSDSLSRHTLRLGIQLLGGR